MFCNSALTSIPPCSLSLVSDKVNVLFALCPFFLSVIPQPHPDPLRHVSPCGQPCGPVFCYWRATAWANYFFGPVHPIHPIFCFFYRSTPLPPSSLRSSSRGDPSPLSVFCFYPVTLWSRQEGTRLPSRDPTPYLWLFFYFPSKVTAT